MLDERYFRHITVYKGDHAKQRAFQTDLAIAIGRLSGKLARALKTIFMNREDLDGNGESIKEEDWHAIAHRGGKA